MAADTMNTVLYIASQQQYSSEVTKLKHCMGYILKNQQNWVIVSQPFVLRQWFVADWSTWSSIETVQNVPSVTDSGNLNRLPNISTFDTPVKLIMWTIIREEGKKKVYMYFKQNRRRNYKHQFWTPSTGYLLCFKSKAIGTVKKINN